ncbi:UDP-glycosyltransferase UGT5 [Calliopsis andreniformis]|uniref:UDP-glycosyltransferase UGT5 n=1 Tax=Calliopsis andreniformis TaxID=337506 RepID=UPI003FCEBDB6
MRASRLQILLCFFVLFASCSATTNSTTSTKFKILAFFGHLGKSHFDVFKPLLEELARRGHDVTVISHFPRTEKAIAKEPLPNYKDVSLVDEKLNVFINVVDLKIIDHSYVRLFKELYLLHRMASIACRHAFNHTGVRQLVESGQKFDVVLTESFNTNCFMAIIAKFNAPFIQMSSHQLMSWAVDQLAISHESSYIPALLTRVPRPMNFWQRLNNAISAWITSTIYNTLFHWHDQSVANEFLGPDTPNVREVSKNVSLLLVNTHYALHGAQLFPRNVIEVGGLHIPPKPNPLPKDIAKFLDEAHEGVLYFNLGSMVKASTMPQEKLTILLKVLDSLPRKIIWKWETDDVPLKSSNVMIKKWLPQYDIMNHPNVKVFFGHGGLLGVSEGAYCGVPMLLMPLYGDQYQNAIAAQARGAALLLSFTEFTEQSLRHALDELFNNTMYAENARKLSKAYRDRPATSLETAVWWTEYVARGESLPYLKSEATNMSWCERNLIDVAAFLLAIAVLALYVVYRVARHLMFSRRELHSYKNGISKKRN